MGKNYTIRILGKEPVDEDVMLILIIAGMIFLLFFIGKWTLYTFLLSFLFYIKMAQLL